VIASAALDELEDKRRRTPGLGAAALLLIGACASPPVTRLHSEQLSDGGKPRVISEESKDLGFGFRQVTRSRENSPGAFEGVGHFSYLYYRDLELCQIGTYSLAPSGRYVAFQDGPSGDVILFIAESRRRLTLQKYPGAAVVGYTWGGRERELLLGLAGGASLRLLVP
jgi:hypothetical protein